MPSTRQNANRTAGKPAAKGKGRTLVENLEASLNRLRAERRRAVEKQVRAEVKYFDNLFKTALAAAKVERVAQVFRTLGYAVEAGYAAEEGEEYPQEPTRNYVEYPPGIPEVIWDRIVWGGFLGVEAGCNLVGETRVETPRGRRFRTWFEAP